MLRVLPDTHLGTWRSPKRECCSTGSLDTAIETVPLLKLAAVQRSRPSAGTPAGTASVGASCRVAEATRRPGAVQRRATGGQSRDGAVLQTRRPRRASEWAYHPMQDVVQLLGGAPLRCVIRAIFAHHLRLANRAQEGNQRERMLQKRAELEVSTSPSSKARCKAPQITHLPILSYERGSIASSARHEGVSVG